MQHPQLPNVVAMVGVMGAGKDTAASVLVDVHGYTPVLFARPLKDMLHVFLAHAGVGVDEAAEMVDGALKNTPHAALGGKTPRHAMQTLGTEWGRGHIGPHVWVDALVSRVGALIAGGARVVVTDVRFPDEAEAVRRMGGVLVRVTRATQLTAPHPPPDMPEHHHISETHTIDADHTVDNCGTIEELHDMLLGALAGTKQ